MSGFSVPDAGRKANGKGKSKLKLAIRLVVGIGIIALIVGRTNVSKFLGALANVNPVWLLVGFLVQQSSVYVWALRWSRLLGIVRMPHPLMRLLKALFVGGFFASFLPTSFSGDLFRAYWVLDDRRLYRKSLFVVFVERFIGLITLGYLVLPVFVIFLVKGSGLNSLRVPVLVVTALLCASVIFLHPKVFRFLDRLIFRNRALLAEARSKVTAALDMLHDAGRSLSIVYIYSLVIQAEGILFFYCIGRALGLPLDLWHYALIVPPTALATMFLPISFNGLGVREAMLVLLTSALSVPVPPAEAVALGVLVFAMNSVGSLIGGAIYIIGRPVTEIHPG